MRAKHPWLGGALLALGGSPAQERAWERGAVGEERVAEMLSARLGDDVRLLHDRRIPGSRANIDHIVVAPSGVWVVDTKRYTGKVGVSKPLFGAAKLMVGRRDKTGLVEGVLRQVAIVMVVAADIAPRVPVQGALCFVDAELSALGVSRVDRVHVLGPKRLAKAINEGGQLSAPVVEDLWRGLGGRFPAA